MGHGHEILFHSDTRSEADRTGCTGWFLIDIDDTDIIASIVTLLRGKNLSRTGRNVKYQKENCVF